MFAKIFGERDDQILVRLENDSKGNPAVGVHFAMPNGYFTNYSTSFQDTDKGWDDARNMLENVTIEQLRPVVTELTRAFNSD